MKIKPKYLNLILCCIGSAAICACNNDVGEGTKKSNEEKYLEVKDGIFGAPSPSSSASPSPTPAQTATPVLNSIPGVIGASYTPTGTSEAGALVRIFVNNTQAAQNNATADGTWSVPLTGLAAGSVTITADATAVGKTVSEKTDGRTATVDATAPAVPVVTGPVSPVTISQPNISGTGEVGSTVIVFLDGVEVDDILVPDSGAWSLPIPAPLPNATYAATAKARDIAGNESAMSASFNFTVAVPAPAP